MAREFEALALVARCSEYSIARENLRAVCYLRQGRYDQALDVIRSLCLRGRSSVELADDLPLAVKVNFATALVAAGERSGGERLLDEIRDENERGVQRLRTAIRRWEGRLTFLQRLLLRLGFEPNVPLELIPPLGELLDPAVFGIPAGRSPLPKPVQSTYSFDDYIKIGLIHRAAREFEAAEAAYRRALSLDDLQLEQTLEAEAALRDVVAEAHEVDEG